MQRQVKTFSELFNRFRLALDPSRIGKFHEVRHQLTYHPSNGLVTLSLEYADGKHDAPHFDFLLEQAEKFMSFDNCEGPSRHFNAPQSDNKWVNLHFLLSDEKAGRAAIRAFAKTHGLAQPRKFDKTVRLDKKYN